uniref:Uncharacterized protein n=1 Tax=Solanum lycopersicum TaxID=4081 RepID=A0A3Q7GGP9_SOLLC
MNTVLVGTRFKYSSLETLSPCGPQCVYLMSEDSNNTVSNSFLLDNYSRELVQYTGLAWEEFKHIRHAIEFLVHKIQQHYRINRVYWDDRHGTQSVSLDASHNFCP